MFSLFCYLPHMEVVSFSVWFLQLIRRKGIERKGTWGVGGGESKKITLTALSAC